MTQQNIMPFIYGEQEVRVITEGDGSLWWVAKDICRVLGLEGTNKALLGLDEDEKGTKKIRTLGGEQEMLIINESGLYTLIFRSSKPAAKPFRKWVTSEVLPAIRRTGCYQRSESTKKQPDSLLPVTREFRAALRLARAMGLKGAAAVYEASRLAWKQTGVNPLELIDVEHLFAEPEQKRRTGR